MKSLELPFTSLSYITPHFRPHEPHLRILALESKRRAQEWEFTCNFWEKRGFCSSFQDFLSHQSLWTEENFSKYENLNFSHIFQTQGILSSNFKLFLSSNPMRHTFSSRIIKTYFSLNLMKYISESNETCFWSNFHRPCMILVV